MTFYDPTCSTTYTDAELLPDSDYSGGFAIIYNHGNSGMSVGHFFELYANTNTQLAIYIQTHHPEVCL